jgi:hypothetical protein
MPLDHPANQIGKPIAVDSRVTGIGQPLSNRPQCQWTEFARPRVDVHFLQHANGGLKLATCPHSALGIEFPEMCDTTRVSYENE